MRRLTDLPVGKEIHFETIWSGDEKIPGVVTERPEWDRGGHADFIPIIAEGDATPTLVAAHCIFVED
jgi:hypothetical protein